MRALRALAAVAFAGAVAALLGYFSMAPTYARVPPEMALLKLSFTHGAERRGGCRELTADELARLAPNMRQARVCARERLPVDVEVWLNGERLYAARLPPTGLAGDGPSRTYQRFVIPAGDHELLLRLRDSGREQGFDYETRRQVTLAAGDSLAIDFVPLAGGFRFE